MTIEKTIADFFTHFNSRDLEKLGGLLKPEARFFFPRPSPCWGRNAS